MTPPPPDRHRATKHLLEVAQARGEARAGADGGQHGGAGRGGEEHVRRLVQRPLLEVLHQARDRLVAGGDEIHAGQLGQRLSLYR